jgi:hypothetical protein
MPYVHRNAQNEIEGLTRWPNGSTEFLPDSDPEVDAFNNPPPPTLDEIYDQTIQNQQVLKALAVCLNDGSIVPGANVSGAVLKTAIKAKM